tara:strand:+ start:577 stop:711 length:135 start_codon:yes stop_codon:yes gene_type:complete
LGFKTFFVKVLHFLAARNSTFWVLEGETILYIFLGAGDGGKEEG